MILTCPQCATRYQADAAKFLPAGRNVRCAKCGHIWHQQPEAPEPEPEADVRLVEPQPPPAPTPAAPPQPTAYVPPPTPRVVVSSPAYRQPEPPPPRSWSIPAAFLERTAVVGGWLGLVVIVVVIGLSAVRYRQDIATLWPASASLYKAMGLNVNSRGIAIVDLNYQHVMEGGAPVLAVTGKIVNVSARELPVPQIRAALVDGDEHELTHWTITAPVMTLKPGQSATFRSRLLNAPNARNVELRFARAGE